MAPGDVAHVPRTPSPVAEAGPVAEHFRSRARLRRLLVRLAAANPFNARVAGYARAGLRSLRSASSLSFLVSCQRQVIPTHSFAALTALIVRCVSGNADRPMLCLYWLPARPPEGHWRAYLQRRLAAKNTASG